ncbi:hypothetical protein D3C85_1582610 [compost metagenome]
MLVTLQASLDQLALVVIQGLAQVAAGQWRIAQLSCFGLCGERLDRAQVQIGGIQGEDFRPLRMLPQGLER